MAKLIKFDDFCVRVDAIVYISKVKEKKPAIYYNLKGIDTQFVFSFDKIADRDRIYEEIVKAMEEA